MCVGRVFFDFGICQHVGRPRPYFSLACLFPLTLTNSVEKARCVLDDSSLTLTFVNTSEDFFHISLLPVSLRLD